MPFDEHELCSRIPGVVYLPETDSTNRAAREHPVGTVVVTDFQTRGRGRLARSWVSEPGKNLLFSVVVKAPDDPVLAPRMCLLWAAAMAEALDVAVKWPNDLVVADERGWHKLGGILAEMQGGRLVVGVGINVNQRVFPEGIPATSLACLRGKQDRLSVLSQVVHAIRRTQVDESLHLWRARSVTLGAQVRVGEREGLATDVRDDGALLVDGEPVLAGDVEMVT